MFRLANLLSVFFLTDIFDSLSYYDTTSALLLNKAFSGCKELILS